MSIRFVLPQSELPTAWFNVVPHLSAPPAPPLHPATREPVGPDDLAPLFAGPLIEQEVSTAEWVDIPGGILDVYRQWRPTPLVRARRLEEQLDTPARIYFKDESTSPAGSHKPNTAVAQAFYNRQEGIRRLTTETGAGQWGSALAMACAYFDLECEVWMVAASYRQKPYRRILMETWGATVHPSPSPLTEAGKRIRERDEDHPGSLGIAISEAVEAAVGDPAAHYSLGSVLNHVLLHQTVIGLEAKAQLEALGETPDVVLSCHGGGSNLGGIALPFVPLARQGRTRLLAAEPRACPTLTEGPIDYDFGDTAGTTPLLRMHTLAHDFVPDPIHAGGLRYHGAAPIITALVDEGLMEAVAYDQLETFDAAATWARAQGTVVAPETAHAVKAVLDEAARARERDQETVILFNLSGHGFLDLTAYDDYLHGRLE